MPLGVSRLAKHAVFQSFHDPLIVYKKGKCWGRNNRPFQGQETIMKHNGARGANTMEFLIGKFARGVNTMVKQYIENGVKLQPQRGIIFKTID